MFSNLRLGVLKQRLRRLLVMVLLGCFLVPLAEAQTVSSPITTVSSCPLKAIDLNGDAEVSLIRQVKFDALTNNGRNMVSIYPNPTTGQVSIKTSVAVEKLQLTDIAGRVLSQWQQVTDGSILELPAVLPAGIYVLKCTSGMEVQSIKLVLNR